MIAAERVGAIASRAAVELDLVVGVVELLGRVVLRLAALDRQLVELLERVDAVRVAVLGVGLTTFLVSMPTT
jgi:hypothetical protein